VLPSSLWVTTPAAVTALEAAARVQVLSRDVGLLGTLGSNADTISHGLNSAKSPARAAGSLVTDFLGGRADGAPLITRIKRGREVRERLNFQDGQLDGAVGENTHLATDKVIRHVPETKVDTGLPVGGGVAVDGVDDLLVTSTQLLEVHSLMAMQILAGGAGSSQSNQSQSQDTQHLSLIEEIAST